MQGGLKTDLGLLNGRRADSFWVWLTEVNALFSTPENPPSATAGTWTPVPRPATLGRAMVGIVDGDSRRSMVFLPVELRVGRSYRLHDLGIQLN